MTIPHDLDPMTLPEDSLIRSDHELAKKPNDLFMSQDADKAALPEALLTDGAPIMTDTYTS